MVPVQVGNENHTYIVWIDAVAVHTDKAGCTAVDQELTIAVLNQNAALEPASATEGITASDKLYLNVIIHSIHS
jgi:3,4-dihydroxy-2-butanone 4-phosphate synthase